MGENHLTYFKIENFKRFDSFEMENLGQYNLLVGDNNVGKTSVLEVLLFEDNDPHFTFNSFFATLKEESRGIISNHQFQILLNSYPELLWKLITNENFISFSFTKKGSLNMDNIKFIRKTLSELNEMDNKLILETYRIRQNFPSKNFWVQLYNNGDLTNISSTFFGEFITNDRYENSNCLVYSFIQKRGFSISSIYQLFIDKNKSNRTEFNESMRNILPNFEEIRTYYSEIIEEPSIGVVLKDNLNTLPIEQFGDGVLKYFRILVSIFVAKGKRLMIDEIETGIHFSRLKDFWKTVITLCKKYDVQLFATTHSLECQKYFVYALAELEEEDRKNARNISLLENKEGNVESVTFDYEQFEFALEIGANTRGGER